MLNHRLAAARRTLAKAREHPRQRAAPVRTAYEHLLERLLQLRAARANGWWDFYWANARN